MILLIHNGHSGKTAVQQPLSLFREDFTNLDNWETFFFSGNKKPTQYKTISDSDAVFLQINSNSSASGLISKSKFNFRKHPVLRWRWKIQKVIEQADGKYKDGDDYPLRIFVMFDDDSVGLSFWESLRNASLKLLYGFELPESSLCFVWSNIEYQEHYFDSPYTETVKIIPLNMGQKNLQKWITVSVDVNKYFREIYNRDCPEKAALAIMSDSDNTGTSLISFLDYIEICNRE
jgi:hypothetical protein